MRTLEINSVGSGEPTIASWIEGFRAAGPVLLIIRRGTGWVTSQDGGRIDLQAMAAVVYETGDWVEYGTESGMTYDEFSAPRESPAGFHPCGPQDAPTGEAPA